MNGFSQTDIFTIALGLTEPWKVTKVEMIPSEKNPDRMEVHITVDYQEGSKFPCPECGESCPVYDSKQKVWRHLNFFQYRCYIHARVPRIGCEQHKVRLVEVPWARSGSGFTLLMEAVLLTMLQQMPVSQVAKQVGEHDTRLWRLISLYVEQALEKQDFSGVDAIGVDEYSHKGQHYITVFLAHPEKDGSKARVLFTVEGKGKDTVKQFLDTFKAKQGEPDKVGDVTSDMCHGYRNAMTDAFPQARTTVDKFHVVKMMGDSVDQIRRREMRSKDRKKIGSLEGTRYLWLKNKQNLTEKQQSQLELLLSTDHLDTVTAYNYRLKLQGFYENCLDYESAVEAFEALCMELSNSRIAEMQKVGQSLTRNALEILNYFESRKTNALLEGFNSMISLIKHRARGFRNMKNFIAMIYFVCGELALPKATIM
jgi:transposase